MHLDSSWRACLAVTLWAGCSGAMGETADPGHGDDPGAATGATSGAPQTGGPGPGSAAPDPAMPATSGDTAGPLGRMRRLSRVEYGNTIRDLLGAGLLGTQNAGD